MFSLFITLIPIHNHSLLHFPPIFNSFPKYKFFHNSRLKMNLFQKFFAIKNEAFSKRFTMSVVLKKLYFLDYTLLRTNLGTFAAFCTFFLINDCVEIHNCNGIIWTILFTKATTYTSHITGFHSHRSFIL